MDTYKQTAARARKKVLSMIFSAQSSHLGSNFSCINILTVLHALMKPEDKIIYSKGWVAASAYFFLAEQGKIPKKELNTYCKEGSKYIGLTEPSAGVEFAGGSMGMGLPAAVGFALAKKLKKEKGTVYVLMSDGEQAIGTTWESALIAAHHKLDNLVVLVDNNELQAMGKVKDILNITPLRNKWRAFGWQTHRTDGHDFNRLEKAFGRKKKKNVPSVIVFDTVKGKGVSFMEGANFYHYAPPNKREYAAALKEL